MTMPEKDPAVWAAIWAAITGLSATTKGAAMAVLISILRVAYDGQETNRVRMALEAIICGSLSLCAASIIRAVGMSDDNAIAVGGAIGFLGVQTMRDFVMRWMDKWVK